MKLKKAASLFALAVITQGSILIHASTLNIEQVPSFVGNSCWYEPSAPMVVTGSFTLPGVSGSGMVQSAVFYAIHDNNTGTGPVYTYQLDMSGMSVPSGHCVKMAVYFGTPSSLCGGNQVLVSGSGLQSASENLSTVYFTFGTASSPCLLPGQTGPDVAMISDANPTTNYVTVIDDYQDPVSGITNHYSTKVRAIVPDIPALILSPLPPLYQGVLFKPDVGTNQNSPFPYAPSGTYDLGMQLYNAPSNGLPLGPMMTQSVTVSNGLFNAPMNFDPSVFFGGQRWLSLSVSPAGSNTFTTLNPPQPISPAPQAIYAYTAGSVADLAPGQAVTSLNGLSDAVNLQAGPGILLGTNGNALVISALPGALSDRNLKTDFATINPAEVLAKVAGLPVSSWRYTNDLAQVRHLGPMAQDFMQAFRLGSDDKLIGYVDENGVALAAIQGLNQKVEEKDAEIRQQANEIQELNARIGKLEQMVNDKNGEPK